jgi:hypothetical protein
VIGYCLDLGIWLLEFMSSLWQAIAPEPATGVEAMKGGLYVCPNDFFQTEIRQDAGVA